MHQWAWSETSLILDLFTHDHGRIAVVARGAKRPYSQLRPVLMPFQRLLVLTTRPKADRDSAAADSGADILTLRSAEYAGAGAALPPAQLFSGFYLNELLLKLLARGDPHERLFDAYADTLLALANGMANGLANRLANGLANRLANGLVNGLAEDESPLRAFELVLLRETGVLPDLGRSTTTQAPVMAERGYQIQAEAGLVPAAATEPALSGAACLALQAALQAHDLPALRAASLACLPALKTQLRALLAYHLGAAPLRTRQLVLDVRRLTEPVAPAAPAALMPTNPPANPPADPSADPSATSPVPNPASPP